MALLHQPGGGGFAVVRSRRIGIFRRQAVFHADHGQAGVVGDVLQHRILQVRRSQHPAAAMDMQVDPARLVGRDNPQRDLVAVPPGDGHGPSPWRYDRGGKRSATLPPGLARVSAPTFHHSGKSGHQADQRVVQLRRVVCDRVWAKQVRPQWVVGHTLLLDLDGQKPLPSISGLAESKSVGAASGLGKALAFLWVNSKTIAIPLYYSGEIMMPRPRIAVSMLLAGAALLSRPAAAQQNHQDRMLSISLKHKIPPSA